MNGHVPRNVQRAGFSDAQRIVLLEQDVDEILEAADRFEASVDKLGKIATTLIISICTAVFMLGLNLAVGGIAR